jgi:uncharacterized protein
VKIAVLRFAVAAYAVVASSAAFGADATDPERVAEAKAIIVAMHMDRQMDSMIAVMSEGMAKQFAQGKPLSNQHSMQVMLEESMLGMKEQLNAPGGLMDSMAQAYAAEFTFAELRQIREFYESPAGQHMLQSQPEIMKQVFPKVMEMSRATVPRACARAKQRLIAEKAENAEAMTCPAAP